MQKIISAAAVAFTLAFSPMAFANSTVGLGETFSMGERGSMTAEEYGEWRGNLLSEIENGETYREISSMQKREVIDSLDRIGTWLDSAGSLDAMTEDQRVRVFNEQEKIDTMLTGVADDSRMVCKREHRVGTRFRATSCLTVAERRRRSEQDAEEANKFFTGTPMN